MTPRESTVPKEGLLLALLCLWIPVGASTIFPDWINEDVGLLVWLLAVVPAFLLSYYRGWRGASIALAAAMAAFSVAQVALLLTDAALPPSELMLGVVVVLTAVTLGSGWIGTLFHRSLKEAEEMALTDVGTGLPNRRRAVLDLEQAFAAAERGMPLSVVLFDLDRFKQINDEHGHAAGDEVLVRFAEVLDSLTRAMNLSARFGGEEFISVVRNADAEGARIFAERVRKGLLRVPLPTGRVTVSAGVAEYEEGMASPEVLVAAADQALYRAKEGGRNRVMVLGPQGRRPSPGRPAAPSPAGAAPEGRDERVLVVDDDEDALRSVARALRRLGYRTVEATSPPEALARARALQGPVDLLLTDIVMPEMSGFRLVELLARQQNEVRVVYMSGYVQDEVDWAGVPGDVHEYLTKPLAISVLGERVRAVLDADLDEIWAGMVAAARTEPDGRGEASVMDGASPEGGPAPRSGAGADPAGAEDDERILLVHEDDDGGTVIRRMLEESRERRIRMITDPATALAHLEDHRLDLLVVDLALDREPLDELFMKLEVRSRAGRSVPALLLLDSDDGHRDLRDVVTELKRADLLRKPVDRLEVESRVRLLLRLQRIEGRLTAVEDTFPDRFSPRHAGLGRPR